MTNSSGTYLLSKNTDTDFSPGRFALTVQADDNIVLYKRDPDSMSSLAGNSGHPYWSSRTWHSGQVPTLVLDNSGNLFYNDSVNGYRNLTMKQPPNSAASYYHYAALDPDGIVRVYAHRKNITDGTVWEVVSMFPRDGCSRMTNYSTQSMNCECPYGYVLVDEHGYKGCWPISVPAGPRARSIWLYIIIGILAISFGTSIAYNLWQRYTNKREKRSRLSAGLRIFSHKELERATDGFKVTLGKGGFGEIYKGEVSYLLVQYHVAVKKLIIKSDEIIEKDFENEVQSIGQIHHKYLVRMIGYCKEGVHRLLVFEYMQGGTLADFISRPERPCWSCLAEAAVGIAKGLEYLHEGCQSQIIHCDIKPENILFDDKDTPKITDFGIAKLLGDQKTHHTVTTVAGTRPYLAPEWFDGGGQVSSKVDVYSFGVMLLEMICCKRIAGHGSVSDLRAWAESSIRSGRADLLVQGDGEALADMGNVETFTRVAIWCLQKDPSSRPGMRKVVQMLEGTMVVDPLPDPPRPPSFSAVLPTSSRSSHSGSAVVHTLQVDY
ncbi:G-type lectin S-receptor-like serine/threonine-protein kinase LECRK3 [Panicum virgatum]|uniref:G-type lectin S-receptor-like serine/threonine-protein kinase LECRK3 n=1 Tax=Panicum virgatum TaxID=38727 RepID=UPI0019D4FE8A|nr:G-type lectin S-receptor-like serine/threonine-protein kinase LECRK3 [Panicum virgatum]